MELSVGERLALLDVLPKEGDYTTLKVLRKLRESLSFSEEEHKSLKFEKEGDVIKWCESGDIPKDIFIGEKATDIIVEALKKLNKERKLNEAHFVIYGKFVGE